jgi:SAM-dependent methyltransferase
MPLLKTRRRLLQTSVMGGATLLNNTAAQAQAPKTGPAPANARQLMNELIGGYRLTQLVHVAAKLGIADQLEDGPRTVQQLAEATSTHADSLYRLLRTLAGLGVFAEDDGMRFRLTPAAELLRKGAPGSLRTSAIVMGEDWMWRPWGALLHSVKTGETAFDHLYGKGTFDWFKDHPSEARLYNEFMAENTRAFEDSVVRAYDFSPARKVIDIGGGSGAMLSAILRRNPAPRGVVFDLDHVATAARLAMDPQIAARCEFVGGDFFKAVPSGGDIYVLKHIIHDWDDSRSQTILANCRSAMRGKGKLLLVEDLVCGPNQACRAKIQDMNMLVRAGGRNRTENEYRALLTKSGFEVARVVPAQGDLCVIEALPRS